MSNNDQDTNKNGDHESDSADALPVARVQSGENAKRSLLLRRLGLVAGFLVLVLALDRVGAMVLESVVLRSQNRFSRMYHDTIPSGIVVLGNSRGVNTLYAPDLSERIGIPAFNLSYNGMPTTMAEAVFLDYLEKQEAPRLLVLEVSNLRVGADMVNDFKVYSAISPRVYALLEKEYPEVAIATKVTNLYRFNSEYFLRTLYWFNKSDQTWANRYTISDTLLANVFGDPAEKTDPIPIVDDNVEALRGILAVARERQIEVRLLIAPYLPAYVEGLEDFPTWKANIQALVGAQYKIWDYSSAIRENKYFADRRHLNLEGTRVLLDKMMKDGFYDLAESGTGSTSPK